MDIFGICVLVFATDSDDTTLVCDPTLYDLAKVPLPFSHIHFRQMCCHLIAFLKLEVCGFSGFLFYSGAWFAFRKRQVNLGHGKGTQNEG